MLSATTRIYLRFSNSSDWLTVVAYCFLLGKNFPSLVVQETRLCKSAMRFLTMESWQTGLAPKFDKPQALGYT